MKKTGKLKVLSYFVKGVTGVLGASLIMTKEYPILTVCVLSIGAGVNELLNYLNSSSKPKKEESEEN